MSYAKIIYNSGASSETITDIWDVQIDPQSITGATYWQQEAQKASFKCQHNTLFDTNYFYGNPNKPAIFRAIIEIYETVLDGTGGSYDRLIFRGWMFQDSLTSTTEAIYTQGNVTRHNKVDTITIYDYVAVLEYYLRDDTTTLHANQVIDIQAEYQRIWLKVPANPSSVSILPLWARPNLGYAIQPYPGFGYAYNEHVMWSQTPLPRYTSFYDARIYLEGHSITLEEIKLRDPDNVDVARAFWAKYDIIGASAIMRAGYPVTWQGESIWDDPWGDGADVDHEAGGNFITNGNYDQAGWHLQRTLTVTSPYTNEPITYDLDFSEEDEYDTNYGRLLITGTATVAQLAIIDDAEISTLDWLRYLLNVQIGWIRGGFGTNSGFAIENKDYVYGISQAQLIYGYDMVTGFSSEYSSEIENYDGGFEAVQDNELFVGSANSYAKSLSRAINRTVTFTVNREFNVGDYVIFESDGSIWSGYPRVPILISEAEYNLDKPNFWTYKGRCQ